MMTFHVYWISEQYVLAGNSDELFSITKIILLNYYKKQKSYNMFWWFTWIFQTAYQTICSADSEKNIIYPQIYVSFQFLKHFNINRSDTEELSASRILNIFGLKIHRTVKSFVWVLKRCFTRTRGPWATWLTWKTNSNQYTHLFKTMFG